MTALNEKRVLYYEDQPEGVEAIHVLLRKKLKLQITLATNPTNAFEAIVENCFDLILLDIRIFYDEGVGMNVDWRREGLNFLQKLRSGEMHGATPANVPVLVITAVANTTPVEQILEVGTSNGSMCRYASKPANLETVEKAVRELLGD